MPPLKVSLLVLNFRETLERVNIRFHDNGTMTYNERRSHVFEPELSGGADDDVVMVPNLPLIVSTSTPRPNGLFCLFRRVAVLS